ncbi:MAG: hypothetical protein Q9168_003823 [Polycauliona sp. 1 TL-2023]
MVYIRQKQLAGLHPYKYAGVDHSLVSRYILKPFYTNVAIKCFPMSMAPNAVSARGTIHNRRSSLICRNLPRSRFLALASSSSTS